MRHRYAVGAFRAWLACDRFAVNFAPFRQPFARARGIQPKGVLLALLPRPMLLLAPVGAFSAAACTP